MPLYEPTIPYRYVAPLIDILREKNCPELDEILRAGGLHGDASSPLDSSLPMARFDRLMTLASSHLGRQDLGFEMGRRINIEKHSPLRHALDRCATLEELLLLLQRYYHLVTPTFSARYLPGERRCEWQIRVTAPMSHATLQMCLEMQAVSIHTDLVRLLGSDVRIEMYLSISEPPHKSRYERLPYTRFYFGAEALPEVRCVIPAESARQRLDRKGKSSTVSESRIDSGSPSQLPLARSYGEWVRLMLREAQTVQPTVAQLAGLLNMSARTLARKISAEGINYRELSTQIRHERACSMLLDQDIPMHQIAYQLGYSDTTAFIRAFRSAQGTTPALFRGQGAH